MKKAPESDVLSSSPDICVNVVSYKDVADVSVILFTYAEHVVCCLCHRVTHRPAYRGVSQTKPHMLDQVTCLDIWDLKRGSDRRFSLHLFCVFQYDETLCWHIVPPHIIHEMKQNMTSLLFALLQPSAALWLHPGVSWYPPIFKYSYSLDKQWLPCCCRAIKNWSLHLQCVSDYLYWYGA